MGRENRALMLSLGPEMDLLIACCAAPGEVPGRVAEALTQAIDWRRLIGMCDGQGTLPLLSRSLHAVRPAPAPPEVLAEIQEKATWKKMRSLGMTRELARIMGMFESGGITAITFKGVTLSYLAYGDIALRDSTDLDIFVPRSQITPALDLLASDGYQKKSSGFRPFLAGACEVALRRQNPECEIDLHWLFSSPYFLQLDADRALKRSIIVRSHGLAARTLCAEDLLIYLCIHAGRECWTMRPICDLAALLRNQPIDWDDLLRETLRAHCWRAVAVGLRLAVKVLEAPIPPEVWSRVDRDPVVRAIADQFVRNLASDVVDYGAAPGGAMLHLRMLDTVGSKIRYLWRRAIQPNHLDADFIRLPDSLAPAYYLIRPLRVACKALGRLRPQRFRLRRNKAGLGLTL